MGFYFLNKGEAHRKIEKNWNLQMSDYHAFVLFLSVLYTKQEY